MTNVINLGTGTSFDVSSYSGYKNFTIDNFIAGISSLPAHQTDHSEQEDHTYSRVTGLSIQKSYNANTGVLTLSGYTENHILADTQGDLSTKTYTRTATCFAYLIT